MSTVITSTQLTARLIEATAATIDAHAELLTGLDQAIGDGDHGLNMKRGFAAIRDATQELAALAPPEALLKAGLILVSKVGGASGPLYGSLLMAMGKSGAGRTPDRATMVTMLAEGVAALKKRGRSEAGEKTMLEVLVPVLATLSDGVAKNVPLAPLLDQIRQAARGGLEASRPLLATKGRASFLGVRSIGHLDPGAQSSYLLVDAVCNVIEEGVTQ
jgi:dihydroxyacetone kinase-like protein